MDDLVVLEGKQILCDSRVVAEKFGKKHAYVVRVIETLISDFKEIKGDLKSPLIRQKEEEYRGQKYTYYEMDKIFFSHLVMRLKGKTSFEWQNKFIKAFFEMEKALVRQSNLEWQREREQGKEIRLNLTDEIKNFIEYAVAQGSENANHYYNLVTKMQYKALGLIENNEKISKEFRNTLDIMDLHNLLSSEIIARKALLDGIEQKLHYKDIFQLAKTNVLQFANLVLIPQSNKSLKLTAKDAAA